MGPRPGAITGLERNARGLWCAVRKDRKSTRLNSSHGYISYAVFCLKKKNTLTVTAESPYQSWWVGVILPASTADLFCRTLRFTAHRLLPPILCSGRRPCAHPLRVCG